MSIVIEAMNEANFEEFWPIFQAIVERGDTYTYDPDTNFEQAKQLWLHLPSTSYVCRVEGEVMGGYYLKANQGGGGKHVCNCGYMVSDAERGKGLATQMCEHSQAQALELGFRAMQFNFVVESNIGAISLWHKLGFATVGCLPKAFDHPEQGLVDALVMYKELVDGNSAQPGS